MSFLLTSCSNKELDRGKAEKLIANFYEYPYVEIVNTRGLTLGKPTTEESELIANGYIKAKKGYLPSEYNYYITEKGKPFYLNGEAGSRYNLATNLLEFNEITGIKFSEGEKKAIVEFTEKRTKPTPLYKLRIDENNEFIHKQVQMELYDDGWRIVGDKPSLSRVSDFPILNEDLEIPKEKLAELQYIGKWKSLIIIADCYDIIEIRQSNEDGVSVLLYPECDEEQGMSVSHGKIEGNRLIFEGDDFFGGLELTISNGYLIDDSSADKFKYSKVK